MRTVGSLLLLLAVGLFYLAELDRMSPLALQVVELDTKLAPLTLYSVVALAGFLLWGPSIVRAFVKDNQVRRPSRAGHRPAQQRARGDQRGADPQARPGGSRPFREGVLSQVRAWDGGQGARLLIDQSLGVPFTLVLEHLSPRHCERAVGELALLLQQVPLPPRIRVIFDQCPEGPAPRHHLVSKALGTVLTHGTFKATALADSVEVMFYSPDPRYRGEW